jgi:hypothetical protein
MSENTSKFQGKISRSSELHSEFSFEFTVFNMHGDIARKRQNLHLWASQILLAIQHCVGDAKTLTGIVRKPSDLRGIDLAAHR